MRIPEGVYFPFPLWVVALLSLVLAVVFALITIDLIDYAYQRIGLSETAAFWILVASILGSALNIPLLRLDGEARTEPAVVGVFGVPTVIPTRVESQGTLLAVNVGGALIPTALAVHMLVHFGIAGPALITTALVAALVHLLARPIPGVGIGLPALVAPVLAALSTRLFPAVPAAPLAYVCGTLGTLIGADLLNLGRIRGLGAPVASIGGAGTFDGIFLTGVLAIVLA